MDQVKAELPKLKGYLPEHKPRIYASVGQCIYCGSLDKLSDEHIIPLGLGGRFILPNASCQACSLKTSNFERTCLRTMYGPLRLLYDLPSRRRKERPSQLQLKVKYQTDQDWNYLPVAQERYPFLVTFPYFGMPKIFSGTEKSASPGPVTNRLWIRGASASYNFNDLLQQLANELGVCELMPESHADISSFCHLLAKIAYSFAVAELGLKAVNKGILPFARGDDLSHCLHLIGSAETDDPPYESLHDLSLFETEKIGLITVRIRLLSKLGTPTYYVALGS